MSGRITDGKTRCAKKVPKIFPQIVQDGYETPDDQPVKVRDNITYAPIRPKNTKDFCPDTTFRLPKLIFPPVSHSDYPN